MVEEWADQFELTVAMPQACLERFCVIEDNVDCTEGYELLVGAKGTSVGIKLHIHLHRFAVRLVGLRVRLEVRDPSITSGGKILLAVVADAECDAVGLVVLLQWLQHIVDDRVDVVPCRIVGRVEVDGTMCTY